MQLDAQSKSFAEQITILLIKTLAVKEVVRIFHQATFFTSYKLSRIYSIFDRLTVLVQWFIGIRTNGNHHTIQNTWIEYSVSFV